MPGIALSTDMIVGFPGETAADFDETLSLTARVRFHSMFSFKYSERPNTLASKRYADDVPEAEKTRRIVALQALQRESSWSCTTALVGTHRGGPGRRRQPAARHGAVGPHDRQHGGELPRRAPHASARWCRSSFVAQGPNSLWGEAEPTHAD